MHYNTLELARLRQEDLLREADRWRMARAATRLTREAPRHHPQFDPVVFWTTALKRYGSVLCA